MFRHTKQSLTFFLPCNCFLESTFPFFSALAEDELSTKSCANQGNSERAQEGREFCAISGDRGKKWRGPVAEMGTRRAEGFRLGNASRPVEIPSFHLSQRQFCYVSYLALVLLGVAGTCSARPMGPLAKPQEEIASFEVGKTNRDNSIIRGYFTAQSEF